MKKSVIFIIFLLLFSSVLTAQSADMVTEMIEADAVTLTDVAYFASTYLGMINDSTPKDVALLSLESHVQFPNIPENTTYLSYDDFAYFCTQVWNIKGGVMLRLTKAPRYAFKELQFMGFIGTTISPSDAIEGIDALTIMTQCIDFSIKNDTVDLDDFSSGSNIQLPIPTMTR